MTRWHIVCRDCDAENVLEYGTEGHLAGLKEMHEELHPEHTVVYSEIEVLEE